MKRLIGIALLFMTPALAQNAPAGGTDYIGGPVVEIEGTIASVQAVRGQGMPFIEVKEDGTTIKVLLGSMRYLMSHDFNPKAGEAVEVEGFRRGDGVIMAKTVILRSQDKTLELRDDAGRPVWIRGRYRGSRGRGGQR